MLGARPVVLASGSPRRRELLARLIPTFEVVVSEIDESLFVLPDPIKTAERLAYEKAGAVFAQRKDSLVIGGDTIVALQLEQGWKQLGKPEDPTEACEMLRQLSGKTHVVITGVALFWANQHEVFSESTQVTFRDLTDAEIQAYVATGEPMDKAGAYAIQGRASHFIEDVKGFLSNVIGLPVETLYRRLRNVDDFELILPDDFSSEA